jgi:RNA polymerase sigma factor for flagellar operon FliA
MTSRDQMTISRHQRSANPTIAERTANNLGPAGPWTDTLKGSTRYPLLRSIWDVYANHTLAMTKSQTVEIRSARALVRSTVPLRRVTTNSRIVTCKTQRGPPPRTCQHGAQQAAKLVRRDAVILEHLPLATAIAVRVHAGLPVHVDLDDLVQAGIVGLIDAASKFDRKKNVAFSSYAKHRIKGEILDSLRKLDWATRDMRRRQKQLETVTRTLTGLLQRAPTEAEVADKLGIDLNRLRKIMLDLPNLGPDFPCAPDTHPDRICAQEQLRGVLGEATTTLPARYQQVVRLYYANELTMSEIGQRLGINESRVSQIHKAALQKMANILHINGIDSIHAF